MLIDKNIQFPANDNWKPTWKQHFTQPFFDRMFNFPYGKYLQRADNKFLKLEYYNLQS